MIAGKPSHTHCRILCVWIFCGGGGVKILEGVFLQSGFVTTYSIVCMTESSLTSSIGISNRGQEGEDQKRVFVSILEGW